MFFDIERTHQNNAKKYKKPSIERKKTNSKSERYYLPQQIKYKTIICNTVYETKLNTAPTQNVCVWARKFFANRNNANVSAFKQDTIEYYYRWKANEKMNTRKTNPNK